MIAKVTAAAVVGLEMVPVTVEVDISNGLPGLHIVGLPDKSVDEAKERVRSAIRASGFTLPAQRITVNLAPAALKKGGSGFDVPMAVAILAAAGFTLPPSPAIVLAGELSLSGELAGVSGMLPIAVEAGRQGFAGLIVPLANSAEAALARALPVYAASSLAAVIAHLSEAEPLKPTEAVDFPDVPEARESDLAEIKGQAAAKRALEIAAAGGHNVLLTGPPGTGKTLLAKAMASILPALERDEALEITKIYSVAGLLNADRPFITRRPFRSPHQSISVPAMVGGGGIPRPGELSLAHRGVLFLDEIPQFSRSLLEALRGPLEDRYVSITRLHQSIRFPTDCLVVASENPCPCGYASDPVQPCSCLPGSIERYRTKLSGPIRDRFDLTIEVPRLAFETIKGTDSEASETVQERVTAARRRQRARWHSAKLNAGMTLSDIEQYCALEPAAEGLLETAVDQWHISVRAYHRILKIARTMADLAGRERISKAEVAEALQYRTQRPLAAP